MNLQVTGVVTKILPKAEGVSGSGNQWAKQEFILTTQEQYPKTICFTLFGQDKIDQFALNVNEQVTVSFDIKSREYNGRWFTDVNVWNIARPGGQQQQYQQQSPLAAQQQANNGQMNQMQQASGGGPFQQAANQGGGKKDDGLPF